MKYGYSSPDSFARAFQHFNEGIYVQISAGHRSLEEHAALYGQGRVYSYDGKN